MHTKRQPALFTGATNQLNCIVVSETEVIKEAVQPYRTDCPLYIPYYNFVLKFLYFSHCLQIVFFCFILASFHIEVCFAAATLHILIMLFPVFQFFALSSLNSTDPQRYQPSSTMSPAPASYSAVYSSCRFSSCPSKSAALHRIYTAQSPVASANSSCGSELM